MRKWFPLATGCTVYAVGLSRDEHSVVGWYMCARKDVGLPIG